MVEFFKNLSFYILPLKIGSKRMDFLENQIGKFGGTLVKNGGKVTHVVIEDSVSESRMNCWNALKSNGIKLKNDTKYVKVKWLCQCFRLKNLVEEVPFEIDWIKEELGCQTPPPPSEKKILEKHKSEFLEEVKNDGESPFKKSKIDNEKYICSKSASSFRENISPTKRLIIEELEKLANAYTIQKDTWRSYSYQKAINALKLYNKDVFTYQEASNIPGIGEKMALKIMEIIESGKLGKVDEIVDEKTKILDTFCKIWGAGPSTAEGWYLKGFRTLEDLKTNAKLTKQQQIGLKLYDELQERIPREEVAAIGEVVKEEVAKIHSLLKAELVGSFRRGKATCGDIDVMIVNSGEKTSSEILCKVVAGLKTQGYLTDDLVTLEDSNQSEEDNHHKKYFGIFKLPGNDRLHRRIDLFVVPDYEYAAALVHYTGSAMFNRSIKLLAAKNQMILTEHGLYVDTLRKGSEVTSRGKLVETQTEEDVFKALDLPYRLPEERDH